MGLGLNLNSPGVVSADTYNVTFDDSIFGQFFLLHPDAANFTFHSGADSADHTSRAESYLSARLARVFAHVHTGCGVFSACVRSFGAQPVRHDLA